MNSKEWTEYYLKHPESLTAFIDEVNKYTTNANENGLLRSKIARLVEVGDKAINAVMDETGFATMCPICRFTDDDQEVMTHSPDCPVTLWNKEAHE